MHRARSLRKPLSLLLLFITLNVTVHSLWHPGQVFEHLHQGSESTCSLSTEEEKQSGDFKPPKHSFIDYTSYLCSGVLLPDYLPLVFDLAFTEPFSWVPQVFLEIHVPPPDFV